MPMTLVSTVTVGSLGTSTVQFVGIPQTGKDLLLLVSARDQNQFQNPGGFNVAINGSESYAFSQRFLRGTGTAASSDSGGGTGSMTVFGAVNNGTYTSNTFANTSFYIANYTGSAAKTISAEAVTENNAAASYQYLMAASATVSAITSLGIRNTSVDSYSIGSTFSLYIIS